MASLALPPAYRDRARSRDTAVVGTLLYLAAGMMFMAGVVAAYLATRATFRPWPAKPLDNYMGGTITVGLVMSAVTAEWMVWAVRMGERRQAAVALGITLALGFAAVNLETFLINQVKAGPGTTPYWTCFYALMVAAAAFIVIGMVALAAVGARVAGRQVSATEPQLARAVAWVWHLAVGAWLATWITVFLFK